MNIFILGHGAWAVAIGGVVERLKHQATFIGHADTAWPAVKPDYVLVALPVQHVRETLAHFPPPGVPVLSLSKGLEINTGARVSQIIAEVWNEPRVAALSGPTFAAEIVAGLPAICTIAAQDEQLAKEFRAIFHQPSFRTYSSGDLVGVELGGALKNIYAIAGGACHGLKLGQNSLAGRNDAHRRAGGREAGDVRGAERHWRSHADRDQRAKPEFSLRQNAGGGPAGGGNFAAARRRLRGTSHHSFGASQQLYSRRLEADCDAASRRAL